MCVLEIFSFSVYQKKSLAILLEIRNEVRRIARAEMSSANSTASRVERIKNMDDFEREEQRIGDVQAYNTLVG